MKLRLSPIVGDDKLEPPPYKFSRALLKDYQIIAHAVVLCGLFPDTSVEQFYKETIRSLISAYYVKEEDRMIGFVVLRREGGRPCIDYLWVDPEHRRQRIGWTLLTMCLLRAKKETYTEVVAYVDDDNIPAQEIFKKAGFTGVSP